MNASERPVELRALVGRLGAEAAAAHGVPARVATHASAATLRKFAALPRAESDRVRAYFWGVVRKAALGTREDVRGLRARYLAAALAEDLLSAGHSSGRVRDEVARRFGEALPAGALLESGSPAPQPATGTWRI